MEENIREIDLLLSKFGYPPEIPHVEIFQYSRASTLKSLIEKKKLWATEHLYLNDPTEFKHGMQMFEAALNAFLSSSGLPSASIERIMTTFKDGYVNPQIRYFISSFTENGDLLSQWRGYGDSGKGLSIGFNSKKIPVDESKRTSFWCQVIYDDNIKNQIIQAIINAFKNAWNVVIGLGHASQNSQMTNLLVAYIHIATIYSLKFKDNAWREEQEWRYVELSFNHISKSVLVRDRESDLIEYIEVALNDNFLSSVIVGPRSNFIGQRNAVSTIVGPSLSILKSNIPWI